MGLSASQARFLGLTTRKTNTEFEGQQVNQQRTALSNQSANYYNDLLGMKVPTPPSVDNFTQVSYTFDDGALHNTITAMIAKNDGTYSISYLKSYQDDYQVVAAASSIVTKTGGDYAVGSNKLRELGEIDLTQKVGDSIILGGKKYDVKQDGSGYYVDEASKVEKTVECTADEIAGMKYYSYDAANPDDITELKKGADGVFSKVNADGTTTPTTYTEADLMLALVDDTKPDAETAVTFVTKENGKYMKHVLEDGFKRRDLTQPEIESITGFAGAADSPYLKDMTSEQLQDLMKEEQEWLKLLNQEYGAGDWMVRYVKDSSTGAYVPNFYNKAQLDTANYDSNGNSLSSIDCYKLGSKKRFEEVKNVTGVKVERDSSGRFINISIPNKDGSGKYTTYALTTQTDTNQDAYKDAMNKYEHEKHLYDQSVQNINSKIQIVQAQDKNLELRLKQLDTEQKAISTEMDSVSKVLEKNIEATFKTFG